LDDLVSDWSEISYCVICFEKHLEEYEQARFLTLAHEHQLVLHAFSGRYEGDPLKILERIGWDVLDELWDSVPENSEGDRPPKYYDRHRISEISEEEFVSEQCRYWTNASFDFYALDDIRRLMKNLEFQCGAIYRYQIAHPSVVVSTQSHPDAASTEIDTKLPAVSDVAIQRRTGIRGRPMKDQSPTPLIRELADLLDARQDPRREPDNERKYGTDELYEQISTWLFEHFGIEYTSDQVKQRLREYSALKNPDTRARNLPEGWVIAIEHFPPSEKS
jgi:hypothetical protein